MAKYRKSLGNISVGWYRPPAVKYGPVTYRQHLRDTVQRNMGGFSAQSAAASRWVDRKVAAAQRRRYAMQVASRFPQPVTDRIMDFIYARK